MEILSRPTATSRRQGDQRSYWLPKAVEFEVIKTVLPRKHQQAFHGHKHYREAVLVIQGRVVAMEHRAGKLHKHTLRPGAMVIFSAGGCHSMANQTAHQATTLTFKFLGGGKRSSKRFRKDKFPCTHSHGNP